MNRKENQYFTLYSNCIPVKGATRSTINDVQRNGIYFISNEVFDILRELKKIPFNLYLESIDDKEKISALQEAIPFLEKNELGFWTEDIEYFPDLDLSWDIPALISNAIIDENAGFTHDYRHIFNKLEKLGCRDIQIRAYDCLTENRINEILTDLEGKSIRSVELFLKYNESIPEQFYANLIDQFLRIKMIVIHSASKDKAVKWAGGLKETNMGNLMYTRQVINDNSHCGIIDPAYFELHLMSFTESMNFNSCLNRKLGIDVDGTIKNCPSMSAVYGNIYDDTDLFEVVNDERFKNVWSITKDQVSVCRDCEFRHVCTDCRAFLSEPGDILSKPEKCKYDPYKAVWN